MIRSALRLPFLLLAGLGGLVLLLVLLVGVGLMGDRQ